MKIRCILVAVIMLFVFSGCESRAPLYRSYDLENTEITFLEYQNYIVTRTIDDERNRSWFEVLPMYVTGRERKMLSELMDVSISERFNWHSSYAQVERGISSDIYTERFIKEMEDGELYYYIPHIVDKYKLISIIRYASFIPDGYVQKQIKDEKICYRIYGEIIMDVQSMDKTVSFQNELFLEGSNSIAFWIYVTEENEKYKIDGWYEMIQNGQERLIVPYWGQNYESNDQL